MRNKIILQCDYCGKEVERNLDCGKVCCFSCKEERVRQAAKKYYKLHKKK